MNKPLPIKIICAYCLIRSVFLLLLVILLLAHPEEVEKMVALARHVTPISFTRVTVLRVVFFSAVAATISLVLGLGLWYLREWARWGLLLVAGIPLARLGLAFLLLAIFNPKVVGDAFGETVRFGDIANAIIVWFLIKPEIKQIFSPKTYVDADNPW